MNIAINVYKFQNRHICVTYKNLEHAQTNRVSMESQRYGIFVTKCYPQHIQSERFSSKGTSMNKYRSLEQQYKEPTTLKMNHVPRKHRM